MDEEIGKGLQMKSQDELIGENGPTEEEHRELDDLNNNFSERLENVNKTSSLQKEKGK
ncbi:hypothetical protein RhiirA4_478624 [Rhizophagus irregularis]|uniref:Uncharacterized protein n=1 Tax=Rhizophagus irregularis TaxID=588596 RepID=A0A2I1HF37_9GLOM|nr:hypothetical protein RhiirA4_478624 [Rhizophagus irregularis]